jgi:hypothetical protein
LPPYGEEDAPTSIPKPSVSLDQIGVARWQYDFWYQITLAMLEGHPAQVDLGYHPALDQPAACRYGATTPELLRWFKPYNENRTYRYQVKPFNFMNTFQAVPAAFCADEAYELGHEPKRRRRRKEAAALRPVAPFDPDPVKASKNCFDRLTGKPVAPELLKTYRMALAQYHLSPESKFLNGEPFDRGATRRRHVEVVAVRLIGKEANKWEEQYYVGLALDAQIEYATLSEALDVLRSVVESESASGTSQNSLAFPARRSPSFWVVSRCETRRR